MNTVPQNPSEAVAASGKRTDDVIPTITITAQAPIGQHFVKWIVKVGGVTLANETSATTTFTMPANDVTIEASFEKNASSGGYVPTVQKPEITIIGSGKADLSADGRTATITANAGHELVSVVLNGKEMGKVEKLTGLKTGDKATITFQAKTDGKAEMDKMIAQKASKLTLMARSKKTAKLNIKVVVKGDLKAITDTRYTVKYKFYRSTKKSAGYKAVLTKKAPTYFNTYGKKGKTACTAHHIRECELAQIVLDDLRRVTHFARMKERQFAAHINQKNSAELRREMNRVLRELDAMKKRSAELSKLFKRLYEDNVLGRVTDEQYRMLSGDYTDEQRMLEEQIPQKEQRLAQLQAREANVDAFIEKAKQYTTIDTLTPELLRLFIQRIEVGERETKYSRNSSQSIRIIYRDIGTVDSAMQPDEKQPKLLPPLSEVIQFPA